MLYLNKQEQGPMIFWAVTALLSSSAQLLPCWPAKQAKQKLLLGWFQSYLVPTEEVEAQL